MTEIGYPGPITVRSYIPIGAQGSIRLAQPGADQGGIAEAVAAALEGNNPGLEPQA